MKLRYFGGVYLDGILMAFNDYLASEELDFRCFLLFR